MLPLYLALLLTSLSTHATTINRCESTAGHITYTSLSCRPDEVAQPHRAYNQPPGSIWIDPGALPEGKPQTRNAESGVLVIGNYDDGCGNLLSRKERREAIIQQRVRAGMNRQEVESALGKPDRVSQRNSLTRYDYAANKGRSSQVIFDEKGCVKRLSPK